MLKSTVKKICPDFILDEYHSFRFFLHRKHKAFKTRPLIRETYKHYQEVAKEIKNRGDVPLRFASYVVFDSTFGASGLMDLMLADLRHYSPKIVICPDVVRGESHLLEQYKRTKDFFVNKYGAEYVVDGYDEKTGSFLDVSDQFDVIYCANPYDTMVNKVHGVQYLSTRNVLPIYINYGYTISKWHYTNIETNVEMSLFYKYFVDTTYTQEQVKKYQLAQGENTVLAGYAKLDSLYNAQTDEKRDRLKVLISPHHTISGVNKTLDLSNFLEYYNLILELPTLFPKVDFVFRPHPLLFTNIVNKGVWKQNQVEDYLTMIEKAGIEYSVGGDYLRLFSECDAIVHDCGSYMVEWLYTGKPCCYVVKGEHVRKQLDILGNKALDYHTLAYNRNDIIAFIESLENNQKSSNISSEIRDNIMINYPNVSSFILNNLFS